MKRTSLILGAALATTALLPGAVRAQAPAPAATHDIVAVAASAGSFETLLAAARAAGLVETLQSAGPFTVFAPTDAAFAKLPEGTVEALLEDPAKLAEILKYHVVAGKIMAADVLKAGKAAPASVQGSHLNVRVVDGKVMVDGATVVQADVAASNGVIHVIDTVILPGQHGGHGG